MTSGALADAPAHLDTQAAMSVSDARSRFAPALVKSREAREVGEFGRVGAVAGHEVFYARYDFNPAEEALYKMFTIAKQDVAARRRIFARHVQFDRNDVVEGPALRCRPAMPGERGVFQHGRRPRGC